MKLRVSQLTLIFVARNLYSQHPIRSLETGLAFPDPKKRTVSESVFSLFFQLSLKIFFMRRITPSIFLLILYNSLRVDKSESEHSSHYYNVPPHYLKLQSAAHPAITRRYLFIAQVAFDISPCDCSNALFLRSSHLYPRDCDSCMLSVK